MNIEELDQLHSKLRDLAAKRATDIAETGKEYRLANTERTFKACIDEDRKTALFEASAPLQTGQIFEGPAGNIYILATQEKPGCKSADIAEVLSTASVFQKTVAHGPGGATVQLSPIGQALPILGTKGAEVIVPLRYGSMRGYVLKTSTGLYEVTGAVIRGNVAHLQVQAYQQPEQKSYLRGPSKPSWVTGPSRPDVWHSTNVR